MEWRKISIRPESKTGRIQVPKRSRFLKKVIDVTVISAYTKKDVLDFYFQENEKSYMQKLSDLVEFNEKNRYFLETCKRVSWPIEDPSILGKLLVPISDRQLEFEKLESFTHLAMFETFTLEQQLLVLDFVDSDTKVRLLKEVSKERQMELFEAITQPADKQENQTEDA